jgi:hypothetical protein
MKAPRRSRDKLTRSWETPVNRIVQGTRDDMVVSFSIYAWMMKGIFWGDDCMLANKAL